MSKPSLHPPTIVSLDRDKLTLCDSKSPNILSFPYPPDTVRDLEVVNPDLISQHLQAFISKHQLTSSQLVFVLSPNLYFETILPRLSEEDRRTHTTKFLDMIPFGNASAKVFPVGNESKLVVINRDFYEAFKSVFEPLGFKVTAVVPSFILGSIGVKGDFNIEACHLILKKMDFVTQNSFLTPVEPATDLTQSRHFVHQHRAVFAVLSVFFVGLAIFTAFMTLRRPTSPTPIQAAPSRPPSSTPLPPTATPAPEASPSALTVHIFNGSRTPGLAGQIETQLKELGFTQITAANATVSANATVVTYSSLVSPTLRQQVTTLLEKLFSPVSLGEVPGPYDILVTTGPRR